MTDGRPARSDMVVMFDVDNTLLDNDAVRAMLEERLTGAVGPACAARFWELYEEVRRETELVNFPETVHRLARDFGEQAETVRLLLDEFPYSEVVYADSLKALAHAASFATPVIVSDGDEVFQLSKIRRAGLEEAVNGNILLFVHKETSLGDVQAAFPAAHYVMVDDKPRIQAAVKAALGDRVTTVLVCQGKYAHDPAHHDLLPLPDLEIEGIGGLLGLTAEDLRAAAAVRGT